MERSRDEEPRKRRQGHSRGWSEAAMKSRVSGGRSIAVGGAKPRQRRSETHGQIDHPGPCAPCRVAQRSGTARPGHRPVRDNVIRKLK
ncbi:MAG: hypothetical protein IKP00_11025 [Victivallales bacterium]|nr:hypothetical protein [Victivallales bacterium]